MGLTYIKLFIDYLDAIEPLGDAERGRLFTGLLEYARTGEPPELSGNERFVFPMMKAQLDRDKTAYDTEREAISQARREAGRLGGLAKAGKSKQNVANAANVAKDKEKDKYKDKYKDKEKRKGKDSFSASAEAKKEMDRMEKFLAQLRSEQAQDP